jgi:hypothetical protein
MTAKEQGLEIPSAAFEGPFDGIGHYALAEITTHSSHHPKGSPVTSLLRKNGADISVVGIEGLRNRLKAASTAVDNYHSSPSHRGTQESYSLWPIPMTKASPSRFTNQLPNSPAPF